MSSSQETFKTLLQANGQNITQARLAIFNALTGQEPMSMHDLIGRVSSIDRASVYRTVDLFERLGVVQRLYTGWKYKLELSDAFAEHHHHITCTNCGRTVAMNEDELEAVIDRLAAAHGFQPSAHQIEIQGRCTTCQQAQGRS
jgi:Fur family transcriptional regulator, ferric uptake regulator